VVSRRPRKSGQRVRPPAAMARVSAGTAIGRARRRAPKGVYTRGGTRGADAAAARRGEGPV